MGEERSSFWDTFHSNIWRDWCEPAAIAAMDEEAQLAYFATLAATYEVGKEGDTRSARCRALSFW